MVFTEKDLKKAYEKGLSNNLSWKDFAKAYEEVQLRRKKKIKEIMNAWKERFKEKPELSLKVKELLSKCFTSDEVEWLLFNKKRPGIKEK